jgi:DNA-binding transcriptional MerR regulator
MAGRKSKYEDYVEPYLDKIAYWRKDGLTEEQIASKLHIAYSTLKEYKNRYSALMAALKTGKEDLIAELEKSLYKRGMGFEYEEVKTYVEKDDTGKEKKKIEKTKKFLAPDTGALIFALKNLRSDKWKDKIETTRDEEKPIEVIIKRKGED